MAGLKLHSLVIGVAKRLGILVIGQAANAWRFANEAILRAYARCGEQQAKACANSGDSGQN